MEGGSCIDRKIAMDGGYYAFALEGENRNVSPPGGHMGPPLRRSSEMVRDIEIVGNGLGHSVPAGSRSTRKLPSLQSLPPVRRGGPMCPPVVGSVN